MSMNNIIDYIRFWNIFMVWAVYIVPAEPWRPGGGAGISQESPGISRTISQAFSEKSSKSQIL